MRLGVRAVPWILALLGLAFPLAGSGLSIWPLVAVWLILLGVVWLVGRFVLPRDRLLRVGLGVGVLPVLFLTFWEGGWWLIPADLAWLLIEWRDRGQPDRLPAAVRPGPRT
jgi:hypothetical protein